MADDILRIEYFVESDEMTDEEYNDQEYREFIVTESMLRELVENNLSLKQNERVDDVNFFVYKL